MTGVSTTDLSHLASALDKLASALWLAAESQYKQMSTVTTKLETIVTAVQVQQEDLDTLASALENVKTTLSSEIATLEGQANLPAGSLDGLKTALTDLESLETPTPTT